jgi:hypothetical protein
MEAVAQGHVSDHDKLRMSGAKQRVSHGAAAMTDGAEDRRAHAVGITTRMRYRLIRRFILFQNDRYADDPKASHCGHLEHVTIRCRT